MTAPPKYRIVHQLGAGGMGTVFMGLLVGQSGFQRPLVLKQIKDAHDDAEHLRLFVEEARRYALLDHENIGRIFDFDRVDGRLCIILEYIDGWSLVEYLERHKQLGRLPDVELSVFIASRVCRALQYVFERAAIVHRDVSPGNIMMTREGTVKLIDFGIATRSGTRESGLTGKPAYMAPEMVVELRADNRSDLFSLGAVLYEMLSGERLFRGRNTAEVLENVIAGPMPSPARRNSARARRRAHDPAAGAAPRAAQPFRERRRDGRGLRALPVRQGLRADQPDAEAVPAAACSPRRAPRAEADRPAARADAAARSPRGVSRWTRRRSPRCSRGPSKPALRAPRCPVRRIRAAGARLPARRGACARAPSAPSRSQAASSGDERTFEEFAAAPLTSRVSRLPRA